MDRRTSALVVATLCLLAGCNGFGGQEGAAVEETVTPAPVPTVTEEPAQGVSENGINAPAVAANHRAALRTESYTTRTRIRWETENGSTHEDTTVHRVGAGGEPFHVTAEYGRQRGVNNVTGHELWSDGNRTLVRARNATGHEAYQQIHPDMVVDYPRARMISALFARLEPTEVSQTDDGATVVSGRLEAVGDVGGLTRFRNETGASMTARIAGDGYVERIAIGFDATDRGRPIDVRMTMSFTDVGSTTVTEPAWTENFTSGVETSTPPGDGREAHGERRFPEDT